MRNGSSTKRTHGMRTFALLFGWVLLGAGLLAGCGGGGGGGDSGTSTSPPPGGGGASTFTIGGTVSGLASGQSVTLQNNGGDNLTVSANSGFTFITSLSTGATYNVTVLTQPNGQTCTVTNGTGTVASANITNIAVTCASALGGLPPNTLGLLVAISGGTRSDWMPDPGITLKSEDLYMALILPDSQKGVVIKETTSQSWASKTVESHVADNRYFMMTRFYDTEDLDFQEYDLGTRTAVGPFLRAYDHINPSNFGFVGKKLYYSKIRTCDLFGCRGGEFRMMDYTNSTLPSPVTLLPFGDVNNVGETRSDQGVLYAITWVPNRLFIYKRNLTTGALGTPWRTVLFGDASLYESVWRYLVNEGTLYVVRQRKSDKALVIHTIDLVSPTQSTSDPRLLYSFVPTGTIYYYSANVDHGYIAMMYQPAGSQSTTQVMLIDTRGTPIVPRFLDIGMSIYDEAVFFRE